VKTSDFATSMFTVHDSCFDEQSRLLLNKERIDLSGKSPQSLAYEELKTTSMVAGKVIRLATSTDDGKLLVVRGKGDQPERIETGHESTIVAMALGGREQWLATADSSGQVKFFRTADFGLMGQFETGLKELAGVSFVEQTSKLFAFGDSRLVAFDVAEDGSVKDEEAVLPGETIHAFAVTSKHLLIATAGSVLQVSLSRPEDVVRRLEISGVEEIAVSADELSLFVASDQGFEKWDLESAKRDFLVPHQSEESRFSRIALDPRQRMVTLLRSDKGLTEFFDFETGKIVGSSLHMAPQWAKHRFSADGETYWLSVFGAAKVSTETILQSDVAERGFDFEYEIPGGPWSATWSVCVSPNQRWVAHTRHDQHVSIFDGETLRFAKVVGGFESDVWCSAFSRDSKYLAVGSESGRSEGVVTILRTDDWSVEREIRISKRLIGGLDFHPELPHLAVVSYDGSVHIVNYLSGEALEQLVPSQPKEKRNSLGAMCAKYNQDGKLLAVARKAGGATVWKSGAVYEEVVNLRPAGQRVWAGNFDHASERLALASESGQVDLYRVDGFECLESLKTDSARFRSVSFSPDDRLLAVSCWVSRGMVWDLEAIEEKLESIGLGREY